MKFPSLLLLSLFVTPSTSSKLLSNCPKTLALSNLLAGKCPTHHTCPTKEEYPPTCKETETFRILPNTMHIVTHHNPTVCCPVTCHYEFHDGHVCLPTGSTYDYSSCIKFGYDEIARTLSHPSQCLDLVSGNTYDELFPCEGYGCCVGNGNDLDFEVFPETCYDPLSRRTFANPKPDYSNSFGARFRRYLHFSLRGVVLLVALTIPFFMWFFEDIFETMG